MEDDDPIDMMKKWMDPELKISKEFVLKQINVFKLRQIIKKLKGGYNSGPDGIPAPIIKVIAPIIEDQILHLVNISIISSTFPEVFKETMISPRLKKGNPLDMKNYRPVNKILELSKILEYIVM